jgi:hypothetical protein
VGGQGVAGIRKGSQVLISAARGVGLTTTEIRDGNWKLAQLGWWEGSREHIDFKVGVRPTRRSVSGHLDIGSRTLIEVLDWRLC